MENTNILKVLLMAIIALVLVFMATEVYADNTLSLNSMLEEVRENATGGNQQIPDLSFNSTNTNVNTNRNTNVNNSLIGNTNNTLSSYPEGNIPNTGIETSVLSIAVFIVFGIIGIYTFKKLSDYSNI